MCSVAPVQAKTDRLPAVYLVFSSLQEVLFRLFACRSELATSISLTLLEAAHGAVPLNGSSLNPYNTINGRGSVLSAIV